MMKRLAGFAPIAALVAVLTSFFDCVDVASKALAARLQRLDEMRAFGLGWSDAWRATASPAIAGGSGQDTSAFDQVLKEVYEGGIRELIPTITPAYTKFKERDSKDWGGREVKYAIKVGRNQGVGAYAERGALPQAGRQQYTDVTIPMRYVAGRIEMTAQVMKASRSNKFAFSTAMEQEMRGMEKDLQAEFGRMIFGDGRGVLALANGDPGTTTTITVDSPGGIAGATNGSRFIQETMLITFVAPSTGAIVSAADETVTAVPAAGTTFTIGTSAAAAIADNDFVVRANKAGLTDVSDTNFNKEPMGLTGLIDDSTYVATLHGVNRTSYPQYASTVISGVGPLSSDVIQRGIDIADQRAGGDIDLLLAHQSVRRSYITMMDENRRYMGGDLSRPDAGTVAAKKKSLTFGGIEFMVDKYAPYGILFGCDTSTWVRYVEVPGEWADEDGAVLRPTGVGTAGTDTFEGYYRIWQNFHVEQPAQSFRLDGVTATVTVVRVY